ncbi:MAG: ABC transporter ATP-binding protein/permease [Alphaproteobacteria bacterium]|nr:ABC transporter ATP-binding protein/permease [Alphaproteobacteria bacterium]MCB9930472.1 ABC transporter ATP-binding protein/permease [Alphaproteobacteria bacterium]
MTPPPAPASDAGTRSDWATIRTLLPYLWPAGDSSARLRVVLAMLSLLTAKVAVIYVPILFGQAIDSLPALAEAGPAAALPLGLILAYGGARVASLAFGELRDAIFASVGQRAIRSIALVTFRHLHVLSLRFHLERQTGGLSRFIERGTKAIDTLLRFTLFAILPTLIEIVLVFALLWSLLDLWFAVVTIATVILYITYTVVVTSWRIKLRRRMNEADQRANTRAIDSLLNYETVKYFGNEEHEARRFDSSLQRYEKAAVANGQSLGLLNVGQSFVISVGLTVIMIMAAAGIADRSMTVGDFVMVNTYLIQLYQPLGFFGFAYREIKQALVDMERMFDLRLVPPEVEDKPDAPALDVAGGEVRFEGVEFGYDPRRPILKGVSFTVPAGKTVAVVGPSGAGKSTISRLLFRFYDVNGGRVLIDGQDIRDVQQASVRAVLGIVPQDTVLFNDTITYNIDYGRPGSTQAAVERAARLAHIHDFIAGTPDGYATMVGERGLKLSGGEKQRVAIARTILKDPPILLFDEATSALDTETEQAIQQNLRELAQGKTALVIAHRLSTVVDADEILVLDAGRIVERGRHRELVARGGVYAAMWARQQEDPDADA